MKQNWIGLLLMVALLAPGTVEAVDETDFRVDTTEDLIDLCTVSKGDPLHKEAVGFCFGFLSGAYHYHVASTAGPEGRLLVCLPDPPPPRRMVVEEFIDWSQKHPEYNRHEAVETWFRYLVETYPCGE